MGNNIKKVFFTADLHIGHDAAIGLDNRPFKDMGHMLTVLSNNFNSSVPEGSVVYYLGDIGCENRELVKKYFDMLVPHTKVLCLGNHDKGPNSMYNLGFDVVLTGCSLQIAKQRVTISHCPLLEVYREDTTGMRGSVNGEPWHGNSRKKNRGLSQADNGQFHIHGHIHSPNDGKSKRILGRQMDAGVVANKYCPVSISTVESWIIKTLKGEKDEL